MAILPNVPEPQPEPPPAPNEMPPIKEPDRLPDEVPRPNPDETRDPPQHVDAASKPPPTATENRSPAGTGDRKTPKTDETDHGTRSSIDPNKQGDPANPAFGLATRR